MEINKKFLLESRILGSVNYKDFISADPNWVVKKNEKGLLCTENSAKTLRISRFLSSLNKSADEAKIAQEARKAAFIQADKTIKATEEEMLYNKPSALKNVLLNNIDTYIVKYFGDNFSGMSAYEKLAAEKQELKKFSNSGSNLAVEKYWLTRIHQTAYAEAIVYKYFADMLKASTDRRSGIARAMNNLSADEKDTAKAWLKDHITDLYFIVPFVDSEDDISFTDVNDLEDTEKEKEVVDKLEAIRDGFEQEYSNADYSVDYIYRHTDPTKQHLEVRAKDNQKGRRRKTELVDDPRKDLWSLSAITTFDTKVSDVPQVVKNIIDDAKRQSKQDAKFTDQMADDYSVNSVPFAKVVLKLFDNDFNFYKKPTNLISQGSDELINDYNN